MDKKKVESWILKRLKYEFITSVRFPCQPRKSRRGILSSLCLFSLLSCFQAFYFSYWDLRLIMLVFSSLGQIFSHASSHMHLCKGLVQRIESSLINRYFFFVEEYIITLLRKQPFWRKWMQACVPCPVINVPISHPYSRFRGRQSDMVICFVLQWYL